jgi:hypothetical protein
VTGLELILILALSLALVTIVVGVAKQQSDALVAAREKRLLLEDALVLHRWIERVADNDPSAVQATRVRLEVMFRQQSKRAMDRIDQIATGMRPVVPLPVVDLDAFEHRHQVTSSAIAAVAAVPLGLCLLGCPRPSEPKGPGDDPGPADGGTGSHEPEPEAKAETGGAP